ncbi:hypothetical protein T01_11306 [Trichinella spiralis]|uniref:Uncharacterized protein n=1 Tax=Trichinella spiralis TaxID=6334 RepID=A0A0V1BKJ4_TRISP|nr:hypothetical protein T01_11306 [Trichinella spiralis]
MWRQVVRVEARSENVDKKTRLSERRGTITERRRTNWRGPRGRSASPTLRVVTMGASLEINTARHPR